MLRLRVLQVAWASRRGGLRRGYLAVRGLRVLGVVRQGGLAMVVALLVLSVLSGGGVAVAVVGAAPGSSADLVAAAAAAAAVGVLASA